MLYLFLCGKYHLYYIFFDFQYQILYFAYFLFHLFQYVIKLSICYNWITKFYEFYEFIFYNSANLE